MFHYVWPQYLWPPMTQAQAKTQSQAQAKTQAIKTQSQAQAKTQAIKETCDLCFLKCPINKWYSDDFFICNKCASCEHCNVLDDKIKRELDINEITQCCKRCNE
jgi:hypothetical protein